MPDLAQLVQEFSGGSCFWVREIIQCIKDNGSEQFMQAVGENDNSNTRKCYLICILSLLLFIYVLTIWNDMHWAAAFVQKHFL